MPPLKGAAKTVWTAGGVATVSWGMFVDHGGGYQVEKIENPRCSSFPSHSGWPDDVDVVCRL